MRDVLTVLRRELQGYFNSPIAYIFLVVFLLLNCGLYMTAFFLEGRVEMRSFFGILPFVLMVFLPAVTMRLWAEEKVLGTDELLLTFPVPTWKIVLGKYSASLLFLLMALAGTLPVPIMLSVLGDPDGGAIAAGYVGAFLLGAFFLALGLFLSGLSRDQIVAFVVSMAVAFALFLTGTDYVASVLDGWIGGFGSFLRRACGLAHRYDSFTRGVVDLRAVFFFLAGCALFLALNVLSVERRYRPRAQTRFAGAALLLVVVAVLAGLVVDTLRGGRLDWTEGKVYTVSPATRSVLGQLKETVHLSYYVSPEEKMPTAMKQLGRDVVDKLEELSLASGGNLTFSVLDPGDPDVAKEAEERGVQPFQVQSIDRDEIGVKLIFSALAISYLDKPEEMIPQLHPGNFPNLEYEVVSRIYRLLRDEPPSIGLLSARDEPDPRLVQAYIQAGQQPPPPRDLYGQAEQMLREAGEYSVRRVELAADEPVLDDVQTLVVLEPRRMTPEQRGRIHRFLRSGGNVILAVQEYLFDYQPVQTGVQVTAADLGPEVAALLSHYGLEIDSSILMDENHELLSIPQRRRFGAFQAVVDTPVKVPTQILVVDENMNRETAAVGQVSALLYLWGSRVKVDEEALAEKGLEHEVLFTSGERSWVVPFRAGPLTSTETIREGHDDAASSPLAVLVRGVFPEVPELEEPLPGPGEEEGEIADETPEPGRLLLVGCARMFADGMLGAADNSVFLLNAVDALTLGPELVNIRGKALKARTIEKVSDGKKMWWRFFTIALAPILVAGGGGARLMLRRRARERYASRLRGA